MAKPKKVSNNNVTTNNTTTSDFASLDAMAQWVELARHEGNRTSIMAQALPAVLANLRNALAAVLREDKYARIEFDVSKVDINLMVALAVRGFRATATHKKASKKQQAKKQARRAATGQLRMTQSVLPMLVS